MKSSIEIVQYSLFPDTIPNSMKNKKNYTYISLFSGAGIGCYGFKKEGFDCVSTVEILEKRLKFQKYNNKCLFD